MVIGKIVKSYSHINYVCQIYGPLEVEMPPHPADYAFGRFVRVAVRARLLDESCVRQDTNLSRQDEPCCYTVGVIYDTILLNLVLTRESGEGKLEEVDILHKRKRPCKRHNERLRKSSNWKRFSW